MTKNETNKQELSQSWFDAKMTVENLNRLQTEMYKLETEISDSYTAELGLENHFELLKHLRAIEEDLALAYLDVMNVECNMHDLIKHIND